MKAENIFIFSEEHFAKELVSLSVQPFAEIEKPYNSNALSILKEMTPDEAWNYAHKKYRHEKGEIIMTAPAFMDVGGDCDDQTVFFVTYFLINNYDKRKIEIAFMSFDETPLVDHVIAMYDGESWDAVPELNTRGEISQWDSLRVYKFLDLL